jgi:hypothetical protein
MKLQLISKQATLFGAEKNSVINAIANITSKLDEAEYVTESLLNACEAVCDCFWGAGGIGKSQLKNIIHAALCSYLKLEWGPETFGIFSRNDKFQSTLNPGQIMIMLDEFLNKPRGLIPTTVPNDIDILKLLVNSAPFCFNKGALEDKGKQYSNHVYVMLTTNQDMLAFSTVQDISFMDVDPNSVYRRFKAIHVELKPEFATNNMFDIEKTLDVEHDNYWIFTVQDITIDRANAIAKVTHKFTTVTELIQYIVARIAFKQEANIKRMDNVKLRGYDKFKTCPHNLIGCECPITGIHKGLDINFKHQVKFDVITISPFIIYYYIYDVLYDIYATCYCLWYYWKHKRELDFIHTHIYGKSLSIKQIIKDRFKCNIWNDWLSLPPYYYIVGGLITTVGVKYIYDYFNKEDNVATIFNGDVPDNYLKEIVSKTSDVKNEFKLNNSYFVMDYKAKHDRLSNMSGSITFVQGVQFLKQNTFLIALQDNIDKDDTPKYLTGIIFDNKSCIGVRHGIKMSHSYRLTFMETMMKPITSLTPTNVTRGLGMLPLEKDAVIYDIPNHSDLRFTSILGMLPVKSKIIYSSYPYDAILVVAELDNLKDNINKEPKLILCRATYVKNSKISYVSEDLTTYYISEYFILNVPITPGMSGGGLIINYQESPIWVGTAVASNNSISFVQCLYIEDFKSPSLLGPANIAMCLSDTFNGRLSKLSTQSDFYKIPKYIKVDYVKYFPFPGEVYGTLLDHMGSNEKPLMAKTDYYLDVLEEFSDFNIPEFAPASGKRFGPNEYLDYPIDCFGSRLERMMMATDMFLDINACEVVIESYINQFSYIRNVLHKPLTTYQAINGLHTHRIKAMNKNSSPGFGRRGTIKNYLIPFDEPGYDNGHIPGIVLQEDIDKLEKSLIDGFNVPISVVKDFYKADEVRKVSKIASAQSRVVNCFSLPYTIVMRKFTSMIIANLNDNAWFCGSALGFNATSSDVKKMIIYLSEVGDPLFFAGDNKDFDTRMRTIFYYVNCVIYLLFCSMCDDNIQQAMFRHLLLADVVNISKNDVYSVALMNKSGKGDTTLVNCLVTDFIIRYCVYRRCLSLSKIYLIKIRVVDFGDDLLICLNRLFTKIFTLQDFVMYAAELGFKITSADKKDVLSYENFWHESITFLKRHFHIVSWPSIYFIDGNKRNVLLAKLEVTSIFKMLLWYNIKKTTTKYEQFCATLENAHRESFLHGEEFFDRMTRFITFVSIKYDLPVVLQDGKYYANKWLDGDFNTWSS